jgi:hypothetical protein
VEVLASWQERSMTDDEPTSAWRLAPDLVDGFVRGTLDPPEDEALAHEVARLLPFHTDLPNPVVAALSSMTEKLGGTPALSAWLDKHPGRPRIVARLYSFVGLLDRITAEPAVVTALTEYRQHTPYPPGLTDHLVPVTSEETLASLGQDIELLLAKDRIDDAVALALATADLLVEVAPRVAELKPELSGLRDEVEMARRYVAAATV